MQYVNRDGLLLDAPNDPAFTQASAAIQANSPMPTPNPPMSGGMPTPRGMPLPQAALQNFSTPPVQGPPRVPKDPDQRADLWRNLAGDFIWSLAGAAKASANAPPGQRQVAAFGGAFSGPAERRAAEQAVQYSQARAQSTLETAAARQQAAEAAERRVQGMMQVYASIANKNNANADDQQIVDIPTGDTDPSTGQPVTVKGKKGQEGIIAARFRGQNIQREGPRFQHTPQGLMDMTTQKIVPGTEAAHEVMVTPELAEAFNNPAAAKALVGQKMKIGELTSMLKPETAIATTAEGVNLINRTTGETIKRLGTAKEAPGPVVITSDPNNPNQQNVSTLNRKTNTLAPVNTGSGTPATKLTPQAGGEFAKLDKEARDAESGLGMIRELAKQGTSAADNDILMRYFDVAAPSVGRRMTTTELNRLVSVGALPERAKVWFQKAGNREIYTPEIRKEIINSLQVIVDGKKKSLESFKTELSGKPAATSPRATTLGDLK